MIELTVKTLDSQNHAFDVDDNITVAQFKEKIAETVNIPADTQRIIYCGRLLNDESKLSEHDLHGKVVHLVQRPPPSTGERPNQPSESPPPQPNPPRRIRGLEYLGSMRFPASAFDQNLMPPLPTHSLAASRLNVARRMLRRAEAVLSVLENPTARPPDQPAPEESQEVTPVFEARVIVPNIAPHEPIDEAVLLSSVHNTLLNAGTVPLRSAQLATQPADGAAVEPSDLDLVQQVALGIETPHSVSSTPEVVSPLASSTPLATSSENLTTAGEEQGSNIPEEADTGSGSTSSNASGNAATENVSRTTEYADLLDTLSRFHVRLAPFLEQYNNFMREDPTIDAESARATQASINRVSEILHFLGHAYHSLSDIIVRVRTPPPRPLLCRPILIQHSAIVQAGIPIQVEAQINFSSERNSNSTGNNATSTTASTATTTNQATTTTTAPSNSVPTITAHMQPTMVGFPLIPGTGVRVETFHFPRELLGPAVGRGAPNARRGTARPNNNNRDRTPLRYPIAADIFTQAAAEAAQSVAAAAQSATAAAVAAASAASSAPTTATVTSASSTTSTTAGGEPINTLDPNSIAAIASRLVDGIAAATGASSAPQTTATNPANGNAQVTINNPNVEFFMEVTPESITIDSLETAFVGTGQPSDILQGSLNSPPPELIQSIMQMAGQLIHRGAQGGPTNLSGGTPPAAPASSSAGAAQPEPSASDSQTTSSNAGAARTTPFQNSQARGNTQTQPTTATHTRSTARPHVHLAQHAMQGFDPFLPCNSHHVTPRRRFPQQSGTQQQAANGASQQGQSNSAAGQSGGEGGVTSDPIRVLDQNNPFYSVMRNIINTVRSAYRVQTGPQGAASSASATATSNSGSGTSTPTPSPLTWMSTLQNMNLSDSSFQRSPTIAQLLQQLPDDTYVEGESIFTDLIMLLSRNLTIGDIMALNSGRLEPLMRIRSQLRNFFYYRIIDGSQSISSIDRGVEKLMTEMQPFLDHLGLLETRDDIDIVRSVQTLLRARLPNIIALVASRSPNSLRMVVDQVRTTARHLCALALRASSNGRQSVETVFDLIVARYMQGIPPDLQQWTLVTSRAQFSLFLTTLDVPESILQPYIVREVDAVTPSIPDEHTSQRISFTSSSHSSDAEPMQVDQDDLPVTGASGSTTGPVPSAPQINLTEDTEPLPAVVLGSETWHGQVPSDWVPIITRDSQRQRKQNSQPPFSDAYLSGMPSKRRKIVASSKPQGSLPQVITESVRRAVTATGLTATAPIDTVAQGAGTDINIQSAYRDLLRSSVQSGLRDNEDFTPERFPNASNYFNNRPQ